MAIFLVSAITFFYDCMTITTSLFYEKNLNRNILNPAHETYF